MSEEIKSEYKIFEDINLENNKLTKVSEISSYDGSGKYSDDVKKSGLYIHTPGKPATKTQGDVLSKKDKGLIVTTGHAQTRLDVVDNISDTINNTVNSQLYINSKGKTNIVSPDIYIKSADSPNTEIHIKNIKDSTCDEGITITTDRAKIISSTSKNKTTKYSKDSNLQSTILDFSSSVSSHIDLDRADIYQVNTEVFAAGTMYGYSSDKNITDGLINSSEDKTIGNALYVDSDEVNIYVDTTIKNTTTSITGTLKQLGNVEINSDTNASNGYYTHIDGTDLNVDTSSVNIGTENKTIDGVKQLKTSIINIGTADTDNKQNEEDVKYRNTLVIGSDYSDLTIIGKDFLIDSDTSKTSNTSVDTSASYTAKSYLRSYYINSNNIYAHDLFTIGSNNDSTNPSHLQLNGIADITGNLDVDGNIDVKDTLYLHSSGSEDTTTSYVKSNSNNESLQINNGEEVIISNAPNNDNDPNQISIKDTEIKTKKNLNLDSDLFIAGKITFDSEDSPHNPDINLIEHLNDINTSSLNISNTNGGNTVLSITTAPNKNSDTSDTFSVDAETLTLTSVNGDDSVITGTINTGRLKQTGNTYINTENITGNELIVKGLKTSIESVTVNIGSDDSSNTGTINIGTVKTDNTITIGTGTTNNDSNIIVKGKDLELTSTGKTTGKSVSYLRVSDINTDTLKVNDSIIVGEESETDNSFKLYGNADISNNLDVHNTIYLHSDNAKELSSVSYIQSKNVSGIDKELVINNDTKVTISNGKSDSNKISITSDEIDTRKKLDLNANQEIEGTLTFDGSDKRIINLNAIQTSSLSIETSKDSTVSPYIKYNGDVKSIAIKSDTLSITSNNTISGDSTITGKVTQTGDSTITGIIKINDGNNSNTTDIDGDTVFINPVNTKIGTEGQSTDIDVGHQFSDVTISGANRLEIKSKSSKDDSSETESKITVDKVSISNSTDSNKVNIYWDPASSTLIFEKGQS